MEQIGPADREQTSDFLSKSGIHFIYLNLYRNNSMDHGRVSARWENAKSSVFSDSCFGKGCSVMSAERRLTSPDPTLPLHVERMMEITLPFMT